MKKMRTYEPCCGCVADLYGGVKNTGGMYTPACTSAQDTCFVHTTLTAKMHIHPASTPVRLCSNAFAMQTIATNPAN